MVDLGLYNHIKNALLQNQSRDAINAELAKGGWNQAQIDEAYAAVQEGAVPEKAPVPVAVLHEPPHPHALYTVTSWMMVIFFPFVLLGAIYSVYYIVPTYDCDFLFSRITLYPATCETTGGVTTYLANTSSPVTFLVDFDAQEVTEYTYSNYKDPIQRGTALTSQVLDQCNVTNRSNWQCTANGTALGFTNNQFFDNGANNPSVCFVSRSQWYRLLYPPL